MSLASVAVKKRPLTVFVTLVAILAGMLSYTKLGKLEDPQFTIKTANVLTLYPGASPTEVELEVTDVIERAVQKMAQLKEIESYSRAGLSSVKVTIKASYPSRALPQIWDELRKRVADAVKDLPPGASAPVVNDDFSDVYGFLFALQSDGFTPAELESYADDIKKELTLVPGVAKITLWGVQPQCVYLNVSETLLSQLEMSFADLRATLERQNIVVDAGAMDLQSQRVRFEVGGEFESPEAIGDLVIQGRNLAGGNEKGLLFRVRDIADVRRGYAFPPRTLMRSDGHPAVAVAISTVPGVNIIDVGKALDKRLDELQQDLPVGIEVRKISWQSDQVTSAISGFMVSLAEAVAIVLVVLCFAMGLRSSIVVGLTGLVMVIVITFLVMLLIGEDLHRMSLGALIIAMGMMVDNAIVVADGVAVRMQRGMGRIEAAIEAATQPSMPLLGATIVAVMAFYPIAASSEGAGEYCAALFTIAGVSLMVSWILAVTIAPIMCAAMLPAPKADAGDPYAGRFFQAFKGLLRLALKARWVVLLIFIGVLAASIIGFRWVDQMFFPAAARAQFMVDVWLPEGTTIDTTSATARTLEDHVTKLDGVTTVNTFVGQGPPRFYLPVEPEQPYSSYAQLIVNTTKPGVVDGLIADIQAWGENNLSGAQVITRKYGLGPYKSWPVDVKISGPAIADADTLRELGEQAAAIMRESPYALAVRTDWRERVPRVRAEYEQSNARWAGISRNNIANTMHGAYDGVQVGLYRERDKLLPIVARQAEPERDQLAGNLDLLQIRAPLADKPVPLSQVTTDIAMGWEDPIIRRFNRKRTIAAQAVPIGLTSDLLDDVKPKIDAIELPRGYSMMWDGEFRSSNDAQKSLVPGVIPAIIIMAIIVVALFNQYRSPLIIACIVPFALIGVTVGLLATGQPFGFVALLGAMSLAGMMIKNAIVLLDEVRLIKSQGKSDYEAIVGAAVSRVRPVILAAGTTVLGVIPLLPDVFWVSMAVVIMFGLSLGTFITMILVPVLYAIFFKVRVPPATEA